MKLDPILGRAKKFWEKIRIKNSGIEQKFWKNLRKKNQNFGKIRVKFWENLISRNFRAVFAAFKSDSCENWKGEVRIIKFFYKAYLWKLENSKEKSLIKLETSSASCVISRKLKILKFPRNFLEIFQLTSALYTPNSAEYATPGRPFSPANEPERPSNSSIEFEPSPEGTHRMTNSWSSVPG